MSVAIAIAESDDHEVQAAMAEAYRKGELRGKALLSARRLLERRRAKAAETPGQTKSTMSADALVNAYRKEASRQKLLVARARATETRLRFIVSAMKRLLADDGFVTLLRAEELRTMPQYLATQAAGREVKHGA
jgi:ParB family chromosome partitioning protein